LSTRTSALSGRRSMSAVFPRPRRRGRWRPFAAGSSGWRAQGTWSRMRPRWCRRRAAQASAARAVDRADEPGGGFGGRRCGELAGARQGDSGSAVRLRHSQCGADGAESEDIHWANEAILVRGKGQKQRYVPLGDAAAQALRAYLAERSARLAAAGKGSGRATTPALFVNLQLRGLTKAAAGRRG
jgi:hypothetical protein